MILRTAANQDLKTLMSWVKDQAACKLWAGPVVRFPLTLRRLKRDIAYSKDNTFAMQNTRGELVGLGQLFAKENNRIHLARVIVSPLQRGNGFGKLLCRLLIDEGIKRFGQVYFTLNVYTDNKPAVNLYQKLGFKPTVTPSDSIAHEEIIHMVLNPD
jgi:ribosomal protein S18 acetylase RimI-like enzyme